MAFTTNLNLEVPARGTYVGTWDLPNNGDFTIIDACFGSVTSKALTTGTTALSLSEAQVNVIRLTGTLTGNALITIPAIIKSWSIDNQCVVGAFAVTVQNASGGQIIGLPPGGITDVLSDGVNMRYRNLGRVGAYEDYAGATVPAWVSQSTVPPYLLCDGSSFSSGTYPALAVILGGTTLPDARARSRIPLDGGTGRVTTAGSGIDGNTRFSAGGGQTQTLSQADLPNVTLTTSIAEGQGLHSHTINNSYLGNQGTTTNGTGTITYNVGTATTNVSTLPAMSGTTPLGGAGTGHNNMQPTYVGGITMIRAA